VTPAVHLLLLGWLVAASVMALLWALHLPMRNAAIVDFGWAFLLPTLAIFYAAIGSGYVPRRWLLAGMAAAWGYRLAFYLLFTRILGHPEEGRYVELRRSWKTLLALKFFIFFQAQALLDVLLSLPFALACLDPRPPLGWTEFVAAALWAVAFSGEATADAQLHAFKSNPGNKGKTCDAGLWKYSRHPNYFFEWLIWVAYALYALAAPWGWLSLACPALMLFSCSASPGYRPPRRRHCVRAERNTAATSRPPAHSSPGSQRNHAPHDFRRCTERRWDARTGRVVRAAR
jgi:steroid 5-alpha reductase family enzyme